MVARTRVLRSSSLSLGLLASAALPISGCSADDQFGSGGASAFDSAVVGSTGAGFTAGTGGGGTGLGCSADLKHVLDATGNVVSTCGPDQGCAGGTCIPACDAAAASKGSIGCDFLVPTPHFVSVILPPCFAAFVTNNWDKPIHIDVSRGGQSFDVTEFGRVADEDPNVGLWDAVPASGLPPGEVAVLFLSDDPASANGGTPTTCPIVPAIRASGGTAVFGSGVGTAWQITTDAPVTLYDILPYGGADSFLPSAELVLPTTAWGTNYVAALPPAGSLNGLGTMWGQVVAAETTTVTVLPSVALPPAGGVPAFPPAAQGSFTLQAGEYIQWDSAEMTGTILQADKPVAFVGGNTYQCYTSASSTFGGCDSGHQQVPAVSATGSEYVGSPFTSRSPSSEESIPYRIVGMKDGTTLTFDPPVAGAPASIGLGQSATFEAQTAFRVTSQSADFPFYIGQSMPGCGVIDGDTDNCPGDEDFVNMLPPAQWLLRYVFFTDPTYPTTNLVFTRKKTGGTFADVTLECLGTIDGWQPIGSSGDYEMARVDLIRNGAPNGACTNGPQLAESAAPFGLTVWGLDTYSSYAYPAGGNATTINTVVVPPVPQ